MRCQNFAKISSHCPFTDRCSCVSRYVELNSPRGKIFSEIISDLSLMSPVDNTIDTRINISPKVDTNASEVFCEVLPYGASSNAVLSDIDEYLSIVLRSQ